MVVVWVCHNTGTGVYRVCGSMSNFQHWVYWGWRGGGGSIIKCILKPMRTCMHITMAAMARLRLHHPSAMAVPCEIPPQSACCIHPLWACCRGFYLDISRKSLIKGKDHSYLEEFVMGTVCVIKFEIS